MPITASGVSYEKIGTLSSSDLTSLFAEQFPAFNTPITQALIPPTLKRGASLYRVFYTIAITHPDLQSPQVVSGLLILPELLPKDSQNDAEIPLAIYNHGTLFGRQQSASDVLIKREDGGWAVGSPETLFNIGLLADQGYALIAPDYVGYGINSIDEAYGVKRPTTAAIVGLLEASRSVLSSLAVRPGQLFLNGWSQGGLNTQWAVQRLESLKIPVAAAAAQSPFNELEQTARWWLSREMADPRIPLDPGPWLPLCVGVLLKSYESWYGMQGLMDAVVKDEVIPEGTDLFGNIITNTEEVTYREIIRRFAQEGDKVVKFSPPSVFSNDRWQVNVIRDGQAIWTTIPGFAGADMLVNGVLDKPDGVVQEFLQRLKSDSPRYWAYRTPFKAWYGLKDEGLSPDLVAPGMAEKGGPNVTLVPVEGASHRQTFLNSLLASPTNPGGTTENLLDWFASFRKPAAVLPSLEVSANSFEVVSEDFGLLPVLITAKRQQGDRPMHIQILRMRQDGSSEVIGSIGGTSAAAGQLQSLGSERVLLQVGDKLDFQLLSRSGEDIEKSTIEITNRIEDGSYNVILRDAGSSKHASLQFSVLADSLNFTASKLEYVAAPQGGIKDGLLQLGQGQKLKLQIITDCAFQNRLGFVRLNQDPITGLPLGTVGDQNIAIDSALFREQINSLLDPGFQITQGGRRVSSALEWNVRKEGVYAPVLITQEGNVFCGAPGAIGNQQMRLLGQNVLGFEDLKASVSDFDWNDLIIRIIDAG
jgi:pimeloyl-ACP methyl ester carboxylesterase